MVGALSTQQDVCRATQWSGTMQVVVPSGKLTPI
jgi:hypothetical protein